ncbi:unnamed protein product [Nesidiocoris tenuis]|uniref:Uncharacterized protein n=1 Tax=Nesidiocoris tenuis TaxID=355587 RepID=A0A6H5FYF8_9HEMI|nr:unnamed protein product [Nesidiocoris tenuis]
MVLKFDESFATFQEPEFRRMVVNGLLHIFVPHIERRFEMSSIELSVIINAYDIGSLLFLMPITYLGSRQGAHRPRILGHGSIILGTGSLIFSLPAFLTGPYYGEAVTNLCTDFPPIIDKSEEDLLIYEDAKRKPLEYYEVILQGVSFATQGRPSQRKWNYLPVHDHFIVLTLKQILINIHFRSFEKSISVCSATIGMYCYQQFVNIYASTEDDFFYNLIVRMLWPFCSLYERQPKFEYPNRVEHWSVSPLCTK